MLVKVIHVCSICDHPMEETIEPYNELVFKDLCETEPENFMLDIGPGYEGTCFVYDKECTQCK